MRKRVIKVDVSTAGINKAIQELKDWKDWLLQNRYLTGHC